MPVDWLWIGSSRAAFSAGTVQTVTFFLFFKFFFFKHKVVFEIVRNVKALYALSAVAAAAKF